MSELSCAQCRRLAAELAFNIVTGRERAAALAHLDRCGHCRRRVAELAQTADQLIELLPEVEPPAGFTHRTATALIPRAPRRRRVSPPITAILLTVALTAGGWAVSASRPPSVPAPDDTRAGDRVVLYAPLTFHRHLVGQAYLYPGTPSWIYVSVEDAATPADRLDCEVVRPDGSTVAVGSVPLEEGHGSWGGPTSVSPEGLTGTRLVSPRGRTVASGQFGSRPGTAPTDRTPGAGPGRGGSVDPTDEADRSGTSDRRDGAVEPAREHGHHRHRDDGDGHADDGDRHGDRHRDDGDGHGDRRGDDGDRHGDRHRDDGDGHGDRHGDDGDGHGDRHGDDGDRHGDDGDRPGDRHQDDGDRHGDQHRDDGDRHRDDVRTAAGKTDSTDSDRGARHGDHASDRRDRHPRRPVSGHLSLDRHGGGHGGHKLAPRGDSTDQHGRSASRAGGHRSHHSKSSHRGGPARDLLSADR